MIQQIVADREACIGSGVCTVYAGATFDLGDDGRVVITDPPADPPDALREAVTGCPTGALAFTDEKGT